MILKFCKTGVFLNFMNIISLLFIAKKSMTMQIVKCQIRKGCADLISVRKAKKLKFILISNFKPQQPPLPLSMLLIKYEKILLPLPLVQPIKINPFNPVT